MTTTRRALSGLLAAALAISVMALTGPGATAGAAGPRLVLRRTSGEITVTRREGRPFSFNPGVYLASMDAAFSLEIGREDYDSPFHMDQVMPGGGTRSLPDSLFEVSSYEGLPRFTRMTVTDRAGDVRADRLLPFCPNSYDRQRIADGGPVTPTFPDDCWSNPFSLGLVWGIDRDWATGISGYYMRMKLPAGRYHIDFSVAPLYADLFDVSPQDGYTTVTLVVRDRREAGPHPRPAPRTVGDMGSPNPKVPIDEDPDPSIVPDLIPLPSFGIGVRHRNSGDWLSFGANVWVDGPSPLVVEGFRREDEPLMDAYQYFYDGDEQVARARVGSFEYDARHGHTHWHFKQFATYELLEADKTTAVISEKEAFCLAPTDAIDLLTENAEWRPWLEGLSTACGGPEALWVREVLPVGWGDTYYQGLPGQSFDVTDLPNGTYYVKVQANPGGHLYESNMANNVRLRKVILGGRPGHRTVRVPPWHGIDTEGGFFRQLLANAHPA